MKYTLLLFLTFAFPLYSMKRTDSCLLPSEDFYAPADLKKSKIVQVPRSGQDYELQWQSWAECAQQFKVLPLHLNGYIMFVQRDLMKGIPCELELKRLHNCPSPDACRMREGLASCYKIHLMPFDEDIVSIIRSLLMRVSRDVKLQKALGYFKIAAKTDRITFPGRTMPIMVLYPHASKDAAQYLLNSVYDLFKDVQGKNVAPRYNERVTSLIYFAQGDGDYKNDFYAGYYEPDRVYYRSDFEGELQDYHLKNPGYAYPDLQGSASFAGQGSII